MAPDLSDVLGRGYNFPDTMETRIDLKDGASWIENRQIFQMENHFSPLRPRALLDSSLKHICTLRKKMATLHDRWKVYEGEYNDRKSDKLCFIVKRSSISMSGKNVDLDVFLANNTKKPVCMVKVRNNNCRITTDSRPLADANANMEKEGVMQVKIEANVDIAFIVALLLIVDTIKHDTLKKFCKGIAAGAPSALGIMAGFSR